MIEVLGLNKFYGKFHALKDLSFELGSQEILAFLGPNGAGKTTTMHILTGYALAQKGTVKINGYDIVRQPQNARDQIGYLPESVPLYLEQTPHSYLKFRAKLKGIPFHQQNRSLQEALEKCELKKVAHQPIRELSKGFRQRVGLADALLAHPPILILDEPTVGLDPLQKQSLIQLILQLKERHSILFSTHILSEAASICSRILILNRGKRLAFSTPQELFAHSRQGRKKYQAVILGKESLITSRLEALPEIEQVVWLPGGEHRYEIFCADTIDPRKEIFQACAREGFVLLELKTEEEGLEEIFLQLVQREESGE